MENRQTSGTDCWLWSYSLRNIATLWLWKASTFESNSPMLCVSSDWFPRKSSHRLFKNFLSRNWQNINKKKKKHQTLHPWLKLHRRVNPASVVVLWHWLSSANGFIKQCLYHLCSSFLFLFLLPLSFLNVKALFLIYSSVLLQIIRWSQQLLILLVKLHDEIV